MNLLFLLGGLVLIALAAVVFQWTLKAGKYRRYPYEQILLVGAGAACGLVALVRMPGVFSALVFGVELVAFVMLVGYFLAGARFPRNAMPLKVGDDFPPFRLPDSTGSIFDSESLKGRGAALYLFYRGNW